MTCDRVLDSGYTATTERMGAAKRWAQRRKLGRARMGAQTQNPAAVGAESARSPQTTDRPTDGHGRGTARTRNTLPGKGEARPSAHSLLPPVISLQGESSHPPCFLDHKTPLAVGERAQPARASTVADGTRCCNVLSIRMLGLWGVAGGVAQKWTNPRPSHPPFTTRPQKPHLQCREKIFRICCESERFFRADKITALCDRLGCQPMWPKMAHGTPSAVLRAALMHRSAVLPIAGRLPQLEEPLLTPFADLTAAFLAVFWISLGVYAPSPGKKL